MSDMQDAESKALALSIADEYQLLLNGRRPQSRRTPQVTVIERNRQEQMKTIKAPSRKKEKVKGGRRRKELIERKAEKTDKEKNPEKSQKRKLKEEAKLELRKAKTSAQITKLDVLDVSKQQRRRQDSSYSSDSEESESQSDDESEISSSLPNTLQHQQSDLLEMHHSKSKVDVVEPVLALIDTKPKQQASVSGICSPVATRNDHFEMKPNQREVTPSKTPAAYSYKEFLDSYKECKHMDKVFPTTEFSPGCFVNVPDTNPLEFLFAVVKSVSDDGKTLVVQADKGEPRSIAAKKCKFLARAYTCAISDIDCSKMSAAFFEQMADDLKQGQPKSNKQVILLQVLTLVGQPQQDNTVPTSASVHRLHALISTGKGDGKTQLNGKFKLYPVVFIKQKRGGIQKHELSFGQNPNFSDLCYKNQTVGEQVFQAAKLIASSFKTNYLEKAEAVPVTEKNAEKLRFSLCTLVEAKNLGSQQNLDTTKLLTSISQARLGVLLSKQQSNGQNFLAFKIIAQKAFSPDRVIWVNLKDFKVYADLSCGFAQTIWLASHDSFDPENVLKLKHVKLLSNFESSIEKQTSFLTAPEYGRSAKFQISSDQEKEDICRKCRYPRVAEFQYLKCSSCQSFFHEKCLSGQEQLVGAVEALWRCQDCLRCSTCLSSKSRDQLLTCTGCNSTVHYDCVEPGFKSRLQSLRENRPGEHRLDPSTFLCDNCVSCQHCGKHDKECESKWSFDFKFCGDCNKYREKKLFCLVCEKLMDTASSQKAEGEMQVETKTKLEDMLKCGLCQMWVHFDCDRMLSEPSTRERFLPSLEDSTSKQSLAVYCCKNCRQGSRYGLLDVLTDRLIAEDKKQDFMYPFWISSPLKTSYLNVIKKPICFKMIKDDLHQNKKYLLSADLYKTDIERIFINAKNFNPLQSEIHRLAICLHEKCLKILKYGRIWEIIQHNSWATLDEIKHSDWVSQHLKKPDLPYPEDFKLKPKDLFQNHEQLSIKQFGFPLPQITAMAQASDLVTPPTLFIMLEKANQRVIQQNLSHDLNKLNTMRSFVSTSQAVSPTRNNLAQLSPKEKWQHLMNDLRVNDEVDTCWYSNPVRISFDNPQLIFEEMCYLCGAFGNKEDFLNCNLCAESFHPYCLPHPKDQVAQIKDHWLCYNCVFCQCCHSSKQWEFLLFCADCDKVYHLWCLEPQLIQVPECNWKCPDCFKCKACFTTTFFSHYDIENQVNFDPNEKYAHSLDFELCFQCGLEEYRKSFCSICEQKSGLGQPLIQKQLQENKNPKQPLEKTSLKACQENDLYQCTKCGLFSHLTCSRTSLPELNQFAQQLFAAGMIKESSVELAYQCLDCLLKEKLPDFYAKEQCDTYENLHKSLQRMDLLNFLCSNILSKYVPQQFSEMAPLFVANFITQNEPFFRTDRLMNEWLVFLESETDSQATEDIDKQEHSEIARTERESFQRSTCETSSVEGLDMTDCCQKTEIADADGFVPQKRNIYQQLLIQKNQLAKSNQITPTTLAEINSFDVNKMFIQTEFRAITKLKLQFFNWLEGLVGSTLKKPSCRQALPEIRPRAFSLEEVVEMQEANEPESPKEKKEFSSEICTLEDALVDNPQKLLSCILCGLNGERVVSGRLIPYQINQFVHVNCAMWTQEVQEGQDIGVENSELYNFHFAFTLFRNQICTVCLKPRATVVCSNRNHKKCQNVYHFPCAYSSGKVSFLQNTDVYCEQCAPKTPGAILGFPKSFQEYPKRRIMIVKNIKPQCTNAFDTLFKRNISTDSLEAPIEENVVIQCNKWRPYYYDTFNRAGNLTILSLSKRRNAIIENLHTYKNKSNTWHDRLKRKFPEEDFTDYAAVRVYWDYKRQETSDREHTPSNKTFFLFTEEQVFEINKNDVAALLPYVNKRIKENLACYFTKPKQTQEILMMGCPRDFWESQMCNLTKRFPKFCQDNTDMTVQTVMGLEKYPVSFWNNSGDKQVKDLEMIDINVASFFYKSAQKVLESQNIATSVAQGDSEKPRVSVSAHASATKTSEVQGVNQKREQTVSLDSIFKQMLKSNQMNEDDGQNIVLDPSAVVLQGHKDLSTRHMSYEQLMACLGKKTLQVKIKERRQQEQMNLESFALDMPESQEVNEPDAALKNARGNKLDQNEGGDLVAKGNDINIAMKYRASKERPKLVEVCTSHIHRNGLFASQPLNPKDIVIEYVGEKIRVPVADKREILYEKFDNYLFSLDKDFIIDATFFGNKARYINHSCNPNLKSEKISVNNETHIIFVATRQIAEGEELTFDYQFEYEADKQECFCGADKCKGRLN